MILNTKHFGEIEIKEEMIYLFPEGLPGFEALKQYMIIENEDDISPFKWLQSIEDSNLAFVVINPFSIIPDYEVEVSDEEVEILEIQDTSDVELICIVVIPDDFSKISANLLAPIILNSKNHKAKQVTMNTNKYKIRQYIIEELRKRGGHF